MGERFSGLMCFARRSKGEDVPAIVVNERDTGERQRFTLAHEVGQEHARAAPNSRCFVIK
jgi:Zn-dependent peptidase ImmA (M78 family)